MLFFNISHISALLLVLQATVLAAPAPDNRREDHWQTPAGFGGNQYGNWFDDINMITASHKRLAYVLMVGCSSGSHINSILVKYRDNRNPGAGMTKSSHGGSSNDAIGTELNLAPDEFITRVEAWSFKKRTGGFIYHHHTRVGRVQLTTSKKQVVTCGDSGPGDGYVNWHTEKNDLALLSFSGRSGDAIDFIRTTWIPMSDF